MNSDEQARVEAVQRLCRWIDQGGATPLPEKEYAVATTREPAVFDQLRQAGVLTVLPRPTIARIGALQRTVLGVLPLSLMESLGIAEEIYEYVVANVVPYCLPCSRPAVPPGGFDPIALPGSGFLTLSVVDDDAQVALHERCEWLGSERALVGKKLVRVDELEGEGGEPVIAVVPLEPLAMDPSAIATHLRQEASRWFARGGGPLRLVHFDSRDAQGNECGVVSDRWACPACNASFPKPTRDLLSDAPLCGTCRGNGWINDAEGRLEACRDCDGFGSNAEVARYEVDGVQLKQVAALSLVEYAAKAHAMPDRLRSRVQRIIDGGCGGYPLATPMGLLSQGERALIAVISGALSGFDGVRYLTDAALVEHYPSVSTSTTERTPVAIARPECAHESRRMATSRSEDDVVLRALRYGCLDLPEVRFPVGGLSVVAGPTGSGKSVLLAAIAARFSKRKKLAHLNSFGTLKRCTAVVAEIAERQTVLEALGLEHELAAEIARTRRAQELGVLREDLVLPNSPYRCRACVGSAGEGAQCTECDGARYDWRISGLLVGGVTVGQLLSSPIHSLGNLILISEQLGYVVQGFPAAVLGNAALGSSVVDLSRPQQRFLSIWGGLAKVLSYGGAKPHPKSGSPLAKDLVLLDGPRVMPRSHKQLIEKMILEINTMGATVVWADIPEGLELAATCVLQLTSHNSRHEMRVGERYLDTRYARTFGVAGVG